MENAQDSQAVWDEIAAEKDNAPAEKPQPVVEVAVEPEAKAEPAKPSTEDLLTQALARVEKLEGRTRNVEGHIGGLTRNQNEFKTGLQAAQSAASKLKDAPSTEQIKQALADPEDWATMKADFPEIAKAVDARLSQVREPGMDIKAIEEMVSQRLEGKTAEIQQQIVDASLEAVFPSWKTEVQSDQFRSWIDSQPADVKALAASSQVGDAARLLKLFDGAKSEAPTSQILEKRQQKLAAAAAAPKGVKPSAVKSPDQMTPQELWEYEARQRSKRKAAYS